MPPQIDISVSTACGPASDCATGRRAATRETSSQVAGGPSSRSGRQAETCAATSSGSAKVRPSQTQDASDGPTERCAQCAIRGAG